MRSSAGRTAARALAPITVRRRLQHRWRHGARPPSRKRARRHVCDRAADRTRQVPNSRASGTTPTEPLRADGMCCHTPPDHTPSHTARNTPTPSTSQRIRRPESHLTPREVWMYEADTSVHPEGCTSAPLAATIAEARRTRRSPSSSSRPTWSPLPVTRHTHPIGVACGETEAHDPEQAPSPLARDRARHEH